MVRKVLPPLLMGEPPSYSSIVEGEEGRKPVGWRLTLSGQRLGWALTTISKQNGETTEVHSRVHFDRVPIERFLPSWLRQMLSASGQELNRLELDAESSMMIDSLDRLVDFDSLVRINQQQSIVHLRGQIDGAKLKLSVRIGEITYEPEITLQPDSRLGDSFAPQTRLPGLRAGQAWTVSSYSPMALLSNPIGMVQSRSPLEILNARVEEETRMVWNGQPERVWQLVFRTEESAEADSDKNVRNRLWVHRDGRILRQQVIVGEASLIFNRMTDREACALAQACEEAETRKKKRAFDGRPTVDASPSKHAPKVVAPKPTKDGPMP